jgi:hypothetical protein
LGGTAGAWLLLKHRLAIGDVVFDVGTLAVASMTLIVGVQLTAFAFFTKVFAIAEGLLPQDPRFSRVFRFFTLEKGLLAGLVLLLGGSAVLGHAIWAWRAAGYGELSYTDNLRRLISALTLIVLGVQTAFSSFFMSVLGLKTTSRTPPGLPDDLDH